MITSLDWFVNKYINLKKIFLDILFCNYFLFARMTIDNVSCKK